MYRVSSVLDRSQHSLWCFIATLNRLIVLANPIEAANTAVRRITKKLKMDEVTKAKIGKYASENRDAAAVKYFSEVLKKNVKQSTVNDYKKAYLRELSKKKS